MYKSIPNNLTNQELTTVVHYSVKMLNKFKSKENRELKLKDLPVNLDKKTLSICNALFKEIDLRSLRGKDIDNHINILFQMLKYRLDSEINHFTNQNQELLEKFRRNE